MGGRRGHDGDRSRSANGVVRAVRRLLCARDHRPLELPGTVGADDVVLGRDRIRTAQVVKQADVVALMALLPEEFADGKADANFSYYEPRCSHGSSLSTAMHGLAAARLGHSEMALRFFEKTSAIDLADTHAAIDGGVHVAALGGIWMIAVLGFAGLSVSDDGLALDPQLPREWHSLKFPVQWRGRHVVVDIDATEQIVRATMNVGDPMTIMIGSTRHQLRRNAPLSISFLRLGPQPGLTSAAIPAG